MIGVVIRIDAQSRLGVPLVLRFASHDVPQLGHFDGASWEPALVQLPDFALDFFGGAFAGQVTAPRTGFSVLATAKAGFPADPSRRAVFADARVRIWAGPVAAADPHDPSQFRLRFDGRLTGEPEIDDAGRVARFDAAVQDSWADAPLLGLFAGTGGIEGPQDLEGQPKPLVLGNVRFARGVLIDNVDNVWMVSDGAVQAIGAAYDRLASLGASSGDHASLAALLAAEIPNGSWATCLALGLVRFGAPPDGRVSFDVSGSNAGAGGYVRKPGAIIRRLADLAGGTVNAASLAALDLARPFNLQLQLTEQTTAREVIARIADSVAAVAGVSLTGELFAQALGIGTPSASLNADGTSALRVAAVEELAKAAPRWKLATEAELTFEVHTADEAAFGYRWQGPYSDTRVYRVDDVVTGPDAASWVYINATPAAGEALPVWPATSNAHWQNFSPPGGAGVTIDEAGKIQGIGDGAGTPVSNGRVVLEGAIDDRPGGGNFVGQIFAASDTGEQFRWDGADWNLISDVTAATQVSFTDPAPFSIQANSAGVTTTDLALVSRSITVLRGGVVQSSGVTVGTVTASPSSAIAASASVTAGVVKVELSQADAAGTVTVPVIFGGITYPRTIIVNRNISAPVSGGGAGSTAFTDMIWSAVSTTTPTQVTDAGAIVRSNSSGELSFSFSASYEGDSVIEARAQYSLDGSTWSDAGSGDVIGSPPNQTPGEEEAGFLADAFTQTGLTADTDYYVRLRCWRATGSGTISFGLPNFTVTQP